VKNWPQAAHEVFRIVLSRLPGCLLVAPDGQGQGVTIRGVGSQAFTDGQRPNVGILVDGIPRRSLDGAFNQMIDVARVEVLKGPQSTLCGNEVSAGAILVDSHFPDLDSLEGSLQASLGSNNLQDF